MAAPSSRPVLLAGLVVALAAVAALALAPTGSGWAWGSPVEELRWYLTGLGSTAALAQLVGNLAVLAVPAVLVVLLWPRSLPPCRLAAVALAAGASIELLQLALSVGRVVSPLDAALDAAGALAAGSVARDRRP